VKRSDLRFCWGNIRHGKSLIETVCKGFEIVLEQAGVGVESDLCRGIPRARRTAIIEAPAAIISDAAIARRSWILNRCRKLGRQLSRIATVIREPSNHT
jgi:hypothetical protein